eukprot:TRINITY_DN38494_c0_g1_i1.p1 TRINITY_DN38494_c0_g1~~TRINITY_DN38494_c0_g1_i1.p1  ORF type:complete len:479 (-),score=151.83 TRINITY_DN38494_c0_g1_i1:222-1658(-)
MVHLGDDELSEFLRDRKDASSFLLAALECLIEEDEDLKALLAQRERNAKDVDLFRDAFKELDALVASEEELLQSESIVGADASDVSCSSRAVSECDASTAAPSHDCAPLLCGSKGKADETSTETSEARSEEDAASAPSTDDKTSEGDSTSARCTEQMDMFQRPEVFDISQEEDRAEEKLRSDSPMLTTEAEPQTLLQRVFKMLLDMEEKALLKRETEETKAAADDVEEENETVEATTEAMPIRLESARKLLQLAVLKAKEDGAAPDVQLREVNADARRLFESAAKVMVQVQAAMTTADDDLAESDKPTPSELGDDVLQAPGELLQRAIQQTLKDGAIYKLREVDEEARSMLAKTCSLVAQLRDVTRPPVAEQAAEAWKPVDVDVQTLLQRARDLAVQQQLWRGFERNPVQPRRLLTRSLKLFVKICMLAESAGPAADSADKILPSTEVALDDGRTAPAGTREAPELLRRAAALQQQWK